MCVYIPHTYTLHEPMPPTAGPGLPGPRPGTGPGPGLGPGPGQPWAAAGGLGSCKVYVCGMYICMTVYVQHMFVIIRGLFVTI